ncbi:MAG: hypothetical protein EA416_15720 [Trueperaceae bacterium]|nr:MAG: hypothetical protein EA416_15720 [Trueperaceae bacterium]
MQAKGWGEPNRNFWLGVYNGVLVNGGEAFFHSALVLAPFLAALGAPGWVIGMIPALRVGGWFLPQLFVASRLAHQPFKLPLYRRTSTLRIVVFAALTVTVFLVDDPRVLIPVTLAVLALNSVAGGIGGVPFADVTAKVVPHYRLGTFWVLRNAIGGVLALLSGLVLRWVFDSDLPFPTDFGVVFLFGTVLVGGAYLSFALVREPPGVPALKEPLAAMLRRLPSVLRVDVSFRRYLRVRFLGLLALMAEPFYAIHAITNLGAPVASLGTFVIVATFASIAVNFAFRRPADRGQNVTVLQVSLACMVAAPLAALLMPTWQGFALVFALSAAGNSGMGIAAWNLLYAVSPAPQRPLYVGVANSILALPSLAPIAVGLAAVVTGYPLLFGLAAAVAAASLAFSFRFGELRALDKAALEASQ